MRSRWWTSLLAVSFVLVTACGNSVPSFPEVRRDAGIECGDFDGGSFGTCDSDEVCLQGFCYAQCSDSRPCGPLEECSAQGVCVPSTRPPVDAGPPDPCDLVTCEAPTPYCRAGVCLECEDDSACATSAAGPVCDIARGVCGAFDVARALCGSCRVDAECQIADVGYRCIAREAPAPYERVCLPTCPDGMTCPNGFTCDDSMVCVPKLNFSCTGVRRALDAVSCVDGAGTAADDAQCAPVGADATTGLFVGACFEDGVRAGFTCHVPCGAGGDADCPAGLTCNTTSGFCVSPI